MADDSKDLGDAPEVRDFASWLLQVENGQTHEDLSLGLHRLVAAVKDTGKKGVLTLKIEVSMLDKQGTQIRIKDDVIVAVPEHDRPTSIFWTDKAGNLTRNDPAAFDLDDLRVPEPRATATPKEATKRVVRD